MGCLYSWKLHFRVKGFNDRGAEYMSLRAPNIQGLFYEGATKAVQCV